MYTQLEKVGSPNLIQIAETESYERLNNEYALKKYGEIDGIPYSNWIELVKEEEVKGTNKIKRSYNLKPMELSNFIKNCLNYIFVRNESTENAIIYVYKNGYYNEVSEEEFKGFIKTFIPYPLRKSKDINEIYFDLTTEMNFVKYDDLNNDENIINFQDGMLNLKTLELMPHSPKYLSTIQIPAKYSEIKAAEGKEPVEFNKYMMTLLDGNVEDYLLILQVIGLVISNIKCYKTKKALFLIGEGDTGKSVIKRLAEILVGQKNISTADLDTLNCRFGTSLVYQKRLVGCNDMSFQTVKDMSIFKQLTGGDTIMIEFKNRNSFSYLFKGFLWFNCNSYPHFGGDTGKWVYDRIMPIYCKNVIPDNKKDPDLFDKIYAEKNEILASVIPALKQLIDNKYRFTESDDVKENREKYKLENNTLLSFINECCEINEDVLPGVRLKRKVFNEAYDAWIKIKNNNRGKLSSREINDTLRREFDEKYVKSNGDWYMEKIVLTPEAINELGVYDGNSRVD